MAKKTTKISKSKKATRSSAKSEEKAPKKEEKSKWQEFLRRHTKGQENKK